MRVVRWTYVLCALQLAACGDSSGPTIGAGREVGVIVSSVDRVLTIFAVDSPQVTTQVGLAPDGSPVTVAVRRNIAIVPLGTLNAAAVVDLTERRVTATVALPANSGATGAAFINDSIALVANPARNSVTPVNVRRGTAGSEIAVGVYPQAILSTGDTAFVLNAELGPDFNPRRSGRLSVITGATPAVVATIDLTGTNPGAAAIGADGLLYVVNAGSFGQANGSLSVIDRRTLREARHETGFGEFPGAIAATPDGRLYIGAFAYGIAVWNTSTRTFMQSPANAFKPGGIASTSGLAVDAQGRLYTLKPECRAQSSAFRMTSALQTETEIRTGICPLAIAFTRLDAR